MSVSKRWAVDILLHEDGGRTTAEARLHTDEDNRLVGIGLARLSPGDEDVPGIGEELAAARALSDLGHRLLLTAAADVAAVCAGPVRLTW